MIATTHDWAPLLARRVRVHDSGGAIAAILSQASATDIITLSGGAPAAKTFPDEVPSKLTDKVLSSGSATALQYSPTPGCPVCVTRSPPRLGETEGLLPAETGLLVTSGLVRSTFWSTMPVPRAPAGSRP